IVVEDNRLTFTFDAAGNELTARDSHGAYTMTYDAVHQVTGVQDLWCKRLTFTWDAVGNRTKVEDSAGGTTDSRFDALGNLTYRSKEHTSELQSRVDLVCRLLLEKKKCERHAHRMGRETAVKTIAPDAEEP